MKSIPANNYIRDLTPMSVCSKMDNREKHDGATSGQLNTSDYSDLLNFHFKLERKRLDSTMGRRAVSNEKGDAVEDDGDSGRRSTSSQRPGSSAHLASRPGSQFGSRPGSSMKRLQPRGGAEKRARLGGLEVCVCL